MAKSDVVVVTLVLVDEKPNIGASELVASSINVDADPLDIVKSDVTEEKETVAAEKPPAVARIAVCNAVASVVGVYVPAATVIVPPLMLEPNTLLPALKTK